MRALVKDAPGPGATATTVADPTPGRTDVLLRIEAASVCGTDREMHEWTPSAQAFGLSFPRVLGHEGVGTVLDVGADVTTVRPGDRVALESHLACGRCYPCRTGDGHDCADMGILGMHLDGVFAEQVAAPERICVPVPDAIPTEVGALLEQIGRAHV